MMKQEHAQLSLEAHECADSVPELNKMTFAVQALGTFRLELETLYTTQNLLY